MAIERRAATCSSTTSWRCAPRSRARASCASPASSTWCAPATRAAASTRDVFLADQGLLPVQTARAAHVVSTRVRARALRPAAARRRGPCASRRRARRGALLRHDGAAARRGHRARRRADLPRPRVPRRPARRAREHLRRLRRRDEDDVRELPALLALPLRRPRRARRRTPRRSSSTSRARTCCSSTSRTRGCRSRSATTTQRLGLPAGPFESVGLWAPVKRGADVADARHRQPPAGRHARTSGPSATSCATGCCASCSPRPATSAARSPTSSRASRRSSQRDAEDDPGLPAHRFACRTRSASRRIVHDFDAAVRADRASTLEHDGTRPGAAPIAAGTVSGVPAPARRRALPLRPPDSRARRRRPRDAPHRLARERRSP